MTARRPADKVLALGAAAAWIELQRARGRRVVLARGAFDLLGVAHLRGLEAARARGDALVVAVRGDEAAAANPGRGAPVVSAADRAMLVASLRCVDRVVPYEEADEDMLLRALRPDVDAGDEDAATSADAAAPTLYDRVRALNGTADER